MVQLAIRIELGADVRFGPGKALLLERITQTGSISAAARTMEMSYKRAWDLIEEMNAVFAQPVVRSKAGGQKGGGATVTEHGLKLLAAFRAIEQVSAVSASGHIREFASRLRQQPARKAKK